MTSVVEDAGGLDTALLARQLRLMEENERRALQRSQAMLLLACCLGELALVLSLGAAVWSKRYEVFPASISDMNADNGPNAKIFFGLLVAMGITLLASKYGQRILRLRTTAEVVYFDVLVPIAIVVTACVPEIFVPEEDGGGGAAIMTAVHSGAAAIVCLLSPIVITLKAIPRGAGASSGCCGSLCQSNPVLASHGDALLSFRGRILLQYHWGQMVVLQTVVIGLFVVFFSYNELYAAYSREREHIISFFTEFALVTLLFCSFLMITRIGRREAAEAAADARAMRVGRARGVGAAVDVEAAASAVAVRDPIGDTHSGGGSAQRARDDEETKDNIDP